MVKVTCFLEAVVVLSSAGDDGDRNVTDFGLEALWVLETCDLFFGGARSRTRGELRSWICKKSRKVGSQLI